MPTAVVDLEYTELPSELSGLDRYDHAFLLLRLHGCPIGQAVVPITDGRIPDLRETLLCYADSAFWESWLRYFLQLPEPLESTFPLPAATVAICTRDRPDNLKLCLDAVTRLPDDGQELLVIDSAPSNDASWNVVRHFSCARYIRADRPGLDIARNCALHEAKNQIIAFADDDTTPDRGWLRALVRNFEHPLVLCVTGLTLPIELETSAQEQFQHRGGHSRGYKRMVLDGSRDDPLFGWRAGAGANMSFRKSVLQTVGSFNEALDMGTPIEGGGDSDMFYRILAAGYRVVYEPKALVWHCHKRSRKAFRRQVYGYEASRFALWTHCFFTEHEFEVPGKVLKWLRTQFPRLLRSLLYRSRRKDLDLTLARCLGAALGPWMYLYSRSAARRS